MGFAMEVIINMIRFIVILGLLIFVHELGHFLVAKKVGIYVFKFSIGFGKRLFGWKRGGTDYCISAIPFGGYVKMAGQEDMPGAEEKEEELPEDYVNVSEDQKFYNKTVWQRMAVVIAGPAMNFILGLILFTIVYIVGMHVPEYMKKNVVGDVVENSPAWTAGIKTGDEIQYIGDKKITEWKDIVKTVLFNIGNEMDIKIKRDGDIIIKKITPAYYDKNANPGIGVLPYIKATVKDIIPKSPAETAGIHKNDTVIEINGGKVTFTNIMKKIKYAETDQINVALLRNNEKINVMVTPQIIGILKGIEIYEGIISEVDSKKFTNIKPGDKLIKVNETNFTNDDALFSFLNTQLDQQITMTFERSIRAGLKSKTEIITIPVLVERGKRIGVYFDADPTTVLEKYSIKESVIKGTKRTFASVFELFASLYYLAAGKISPKELAGPVGIYKITADFARTGFVMLLSFIAFLSVNLSVINLLPIPVLDGGHVLFLSLEAIIRRPLNEKFVEICQKIGFALLMLLIVYTLWNDIVHRIIGK